MATTPTNPTPTPNPERYIVIASSSGPADGMDFYGPFDDANDATEWAINELPNAYWWVNKLHDPTDPA